MQMERTLHLLQEARALFSPMEERAFAEGRGLDPRTMDNVGGVLSTQTDPLR
jgi:hypothetical protein